MQGVRRRKYKKIALFICEKTEKEVCNLKKYKASKKHVLFCCSYREKRSIFFENIGVKNYCKYFCLRKRCTQSQMRKINWATH